jgi:3D (Asp-Asp-Asp) domain-containing protein
MRRAPLWIVVAVVASLAGASCSAVPWGRREEVATRPPPSPELKPRITDFMATAYSDQGTTASGHEAQEGIVAADPKVLPLGSRIRVHDAGKYSGVYRVKDTGGKIDGHEIDIFIADDAEAKRFGKKRVKVEVLSEGTDRR